MNPEISKPEADIFSWIATGELAGVSPGDTKERVVALFGIPPGWVHSEQWDEIPEYMNADMWGYGIWTLYFEGNVLDAITCSVSHDDGQAHGWYFDMAAFDNSFFKSIWDAERMLAERGIPYVELQGERHKIMDVTSGETHETRRRLPLPTILAGSECQTRLLFDTENGELRVIANPYSLKRQVVSKRRIDTNIKYVLVY
ncbi:hypothetical protein UNDYM_4108 [Undibacterium sp. YM2]|uniref:hypothetical protein n=1 Tax=Undibacterium sp. YM2 TaxID=2058625 RepID=UPI001331CFF6|nr:hypothetical protein [Undibacterium sp. YM2]BBB68361.1 hypothetical protein UNDYM_4108 [Undibacterium sp. YM2]